ncbi:MAG: hypothetical protein AAFX87_20140 [Bacteroidota bacterium]
MSIEIIYPTTNTAVERWKESLEEMVVAFKLTKDPSVFHPILIHGHERIVGPEEIEAYLDRFKEELAQFRYSACDEYFFDDTQ